MRPGRASVSGVYFHTLGCPKNDADSRVLGRQLERLGVPVVADASLCTHVVINTCGFIEDAKEESIAAILEACETYADRRVLVMGCLVERYRRELVEGIPEVAGWFGVLDVDTAERLAEAILGGPQEGSSDPSPASARKGSYAYVKISDGCDEKCTFCAIPGFKGRYQSLPTQEILDEADHCLAEGARELVLVGQDTTRWRSGSLDLLGLIDELSGDARLHRIRVMYLQPTRVGQRFLRYMAADAKLCRYLDIPFQHSHEEILRRMGRGGSGKEYLELLARARTEMPEVSVRSTFIVGFPGEEERHFEDLLEFVESARFDYGGAFVYSPEDGTEAASLGPAVPSAVATERLNRLNESILATGERERSRLVGNDVQVLVEELDGELSMEGIVAMGRTEGQAPEVDGVALLRGRAPVDLAPGDLVTARIEEVVGCDLVGEIVAS